MLVFIGIGLIALWLLGIITSNVLSGYIHILLIIGLTLFLARIVLGKGKDPSLKKHRK